jgi:hypothetical protein
MPSQRSQRRFGRGEDDGVVVGDELGLLAMAKFSYVDIAYLPSKRTI